MSERIFGDTLTPVDALFFGPHPDDVELYAGGLVANLSSAGHAVGICDLTRGELGTLGTPEIRKQEAAAAAAVLCVAWRLQLGLADGSLAKAGLTDPGPAVPEALIRLIREVRPAIVVAPYWHDRHPDHRAASQLVADAVFFANLGRAFPNAGPAHEVLQVLYYPTRVEAAASFVVDVSSAYPLKQRAIGCYASQIRTPLQGSVPLVSSPLSLSSLEARDAHLGALIGVAHGEGFVLKSAVPIKDPVQHFTHHRAATPLFYLR